MRFTDLPPLVVLALVWYFGPAQPWTERRVGSEAGVLEAVGNEGTGNGPLSSAQVVRVEQAASPLRSARPWHFPISVPT